MSDRIPPRVEGAPGLVWRERQIGWVAEWHARTDLVERGYKPKSARLWAGVVPGDAERAMIADECTRKQTEMLVWGRGGIPTIPTIGTLAELISAYQEDVDSPYHKIRYRSRQSYNNQLKRIAAAYGDIPLTEIKSRLLLRWHEGWASGGRVSMAHGMIGMLRTVFGFGATFLEDSANEECERLSVALHRMRFKQGGHREEVITADQANAIRAKAHEMNLHSIALAQAFQFELMLRQKDVIGEWVPLSEPGTTDVTYGNQKWLRGLRWSEIDNDLILRHTTSKRQKDIEVDLKLAPMVMDEIKDLMGMPDTGPVVISERYERPYEANAYRLLWRKVARAAGVPDTVFSMDSRAGAITEALSSGAPLDSVRKSATHSDASMTQRYSRGDAEASSNVMQMRAASRNKK